MVIYITLATMNLQHWSSRTNPVEWSTPVITSYPYASLIYLFEVLVQTVQKNKRVHMLKSTHNRRMYSDLGRRTEPIKSATQR